MRIGREGTGSRVRSPPPPWLLPTILGTISNFVLALPAAARHGEVVRIGAADAGSSFRGGPNPSRRRHERSSPPRRSGRVRRAGGGGNGRRNREPPPRPRQPEASPEVAACASAFGGTTNTASGLESVVGGGVTNTASSPLAAILGGGGNVARGEGSTIPGGIENETLALCTLAAGRRARTRFDGSFVWADVAGAAGVDGDPFRTDTRSNQFNAFASGGVRFVTRYAADGAPVAVAELAPGGSSWLSQLDRGSVADLRPADPREVLLKLRSIPLSTWSFAAQDPAIRHLGPLAPDFMEAFGLGESNRHIGHLDADGVAFAAIQGLALELDARDARIASLEQAQRSIEERGLQVAAERNGRIAELETVVAASASRIGELEARLERLLEAGVAK